MRQILFRGKRADNNEWVEGAYGVLGEGTDIERHVIMQSTLDTNCSVERFYFADIEVIPETVGQFTGLTDKNGVNIFEGDIYVYDDYSKGAFFGSGQPTRKAAVEIDNLLIGMVRPYGAVMTKGDKIEVIGNIYDNPELLK